MTMTSGNSISASGQRNEPSRTSEQAGYTSPTDGAIGCFISAASGEVIDVAGWAMQENGTPIICWHRKSADKLNQQWLTQSAGENGSFLLSPLSWPNGAVDVLHTPPRYRMPDTAIQWEKLGQSSQLWQFADRGADGLCIVNQRSKGLLTYNGKGKPLLVKAYNPSDNCQVWYFDLD
jgi:hypothetical protein